jgi:hypothetical protein
MRLVILVVVVGLHPSGDLEVVQQVLVLISAALRR